MPLHTLASPIVQLLPSVFRSLLVMPIAPPSSAASPQMVAQPHPRSECACHRAQPSMAAHRGKAVMLRDTPPGRGRGPGNSQGQGQAQGPLVLELLSCALKGMRIALAAGLLACFGLPALSASTSPAPAGLTVQRSTRVFPHRFNVHPDGATVAANQTQRFEVTDAQGKTVAVHWNVSGLGCSGLACGSVDDQGIYHTPSTLPHPGVVILEGVLDSNPNYSVLTQIELVPVAKTGVAPSVTPAPAQVAGAKTPKTQSIAAPTLSGSQDIARNTALPPLPAAVAAAPVVGRQNVARSTPSPQPTVTRPLPAIEGNNVAPEHSLLPLPNAVAASPTLERQIARASQAPPTPNVTGPLPVVEVKHVAPAHSLPPLPAAVGAAPAAERQVIARATPPPPLPNAAAPLPAVAKPLVSNAQVANARVENAPVENAQVEKKIVSPRRTAPSPPAAATAGPSAKTQTIDLESLAPPASVSVRVPTATPTPMPVKEVKTTPPAHVTPPVPNPPTAAPAVDTQIVARASTPPPLSNVSAVSTPSPAIAGSDGRIEGKIEAKTQTKTQAKIETKIEAEPVPASHQLLPPPSTIVTTPSDRRLQLCTVAANKIVLARCNRYHACFSTDLATELAGGNDCCQPRYTSALAR